MIETYALQVFGSDLTPRTTPILVSFDLSYHSMLDHTLFDKSIFNNLVKKNIKFYLYLKTLTKCNGFSVNSMMH